MGPEAFFTTPNLRAREADRGETEGRKSWPAVVGVRLPRPEGNDVILLFPITSQAPSPSRLAAEIPAIEKRRGGLATDTRRWLILDEYNQDVIGRSFYLVPEAKVGQLSKAFLLPLLQAAVTRRERIERVDRRG